MIDLAGGTHASAWSTIPTLEDGSVHMAPGSVNGTGESKLRECRYNAQEWPCVLGLHVVGNTLKPKKARYNKGMAKRKNTLGIGITEGNVVWKGQPKNTQTNTHRVPTHTHTHIHTQRERERHI